MMVKSWQTLEFLLLKNHVNKKKTTSYQFPIIPGLHVHALARVLCVLEGRWALAAPGSNPRYRWGNMMKNQRVGHPEDFAVENAGFQQPKWKNIWKLKQGMGIEWD